MKLAYVVGVYPEPSETFIAREIAGLRARGHVVHIFSLFVPDSGQLAGVEYGWWGWSRMMRKLDPESSNTALSRRWAARFSELAVDAVVAHFASQPSTVALEAVGELPFFLSLHARDIYVEAEELREKLARATAAVTCTSANVDYLNMTYPDFGSKIQLVYHGLPARWLDAPVPERKRRPNEPLRLLAVGRMVEKKGYHVLLKALEITNVPVTLRLAGDGPLRMELEDAAHQLGLADKVTFTGWLSEEELLLEYAYADVFCCPSIPAQDGDQDGLPNVLVEALSTGLPAVGSDFSAIPEAIIDHENGLLAHYGDHVLLAIAISRLADPALRATLGTRARELVLEKFNSEPWLDKLAGIFREGIG
ncbi:MAG: glycosyltransferase family 4 protein [bacterium]